MPDDEVLGAIETQVALLMRLGEATRRATDLKPHRALDRAAYVILRHLQSDGPRNVSEDVMVNHILRVICQGLGRRER